MSVFKEMNPRQIGPAGMSGRVTCIDVIENQTNTIFIGTASGGVWKSNSGGTTWIPISDSMATLNIGAIAIQQSNPSVIWVGTGEGNPRNSQNSGRGVYRTLDGGRNWELMGLEDTRNIHRVIIHPDEPNTIWVGAQGPQWGDNENRGVYKTTDGGKTWDLVLKGSNDVGIGDLVIDPNNPNKLIANMWQFRRNPWFFKSGGEKGGLYITVDGGETWKKQSKEDGLPEGELGRIGISFAPSDPSRVYALIEATKNELYRSDDGGHSWYKISSDKNAGNRPFYYSDIFVDPQNENRIYSLWSRVSMSEDGGKTWKIIIPYYNVHPDNHAFWIDPNNPDYVIVGNDGGLAISRDRARTWRFIENLPLAQFYHINIDNEIPYNVYGGMQDNGSYRGPAYIWASGGIRNSYFEMLSFGDGFDVSPDPDNAARYGYSMSQRGYVVQYDLLTGYSKDVRPSPADTIPLRFNWNAPIAQDNFDNNTIYFGSQFVHKSTDKGDSWDIISPDLTTNDTSKQHQDKSGGLTFDVTGAEIYTTLTTINPSKLDKNVIWVGSDDGRLSLTKDGGKSWTYLESKLPEMPEGAWIPQIHPSNHNVNEAFVVVNDYRRNNWNPFLYYTNDAGKSWKRIANSTDFPGYCLSVIQDPVSPNLIFVGTENGLYVSFDKGENWNHWTHGYPNVSTMDMKIQERERDLVLGTFGRAIYILDDISALRDLANSSMDNWEKEKLKLFEIPDAYQAQYSSPPGVLFSANATFKGQNRSSSARLKVYYNQETEEGEEEKKAKGKLRVFNSNGDTIRTMKVELADGINNLSWGLSAKRNRFANEKKPKEGEEYGGRPILPGIYTIEIECDSIKSTQKINVKSDPRIEISMDELKLQQERFSKAEDLMAKVTIMCDELKANQAAIKKVKNMMPTEKDSLFKQASKMGKEMNDTMQVMLDEIFGERDVKGIFRESDILIDKVQKPLWKVWGNLSGNEQAFNNYYRLAEDAYEKHNKAVQQLLNNEWEEYKKLVKSLEFDPFEE
jgi:photosystem II stability/assembly factor-like uncharacterized protein